MERIDLFRLYELGASVRPLGQIKNESTAAEAFSVFIAAQQAIKELLGSEPQVKIDICTQAAKDLLDSLDDFERMHFLNKEGQFSFPEPNLKVKPWIVFRLKQSLQSFDAVFRAEMQKAATYRVPKRGIYDVADLVDRAGDTFAPDVRHLMGQVAVSEYQQAGRCFAFGLYTAAGYHACRSVEAVLRIYYRFFVGRADDSTATWGALLSDLEKCQEVIPSKKTLSHVRHVKDFDRNPLSHLRAVLDNSDADILISGAKVVITAMCRDMSTATVDVEPELDLPAVGAQTDSGFAVEMPPTPKRRAT